VNFFSRVDVDAEGRMHFHAGNSSTGSFVELRAESNTLIVLNTCQHPLDPSPNYAPKPVRLEVFQAEPAGADDYCRNFRSENKRSFELTERLYL
jgi:hypothetical protein